MYVHESPVHFHIVTICLEMDKTSWTYRTSQMVLYGTDRVRTKPVFRVAELVPAVGILHCVRKIVLSLKKKNVHFVDTKKNLMRGIIPQDPYQGFLNHNNNQTK